MSPSTPQQYDSTILLTGGTQGMGVHTALFLAKQCPSSLLILSSRTDPNNIAHTTNTKLGQSNTTFLPLNLAPISKVHAYVSNFKAQGYPKIKSLVLNAGVQIPGAIEYTEDGYERNLAVNHIGHAALFHGLMDAGFLAPDCKIVITTSSVHDPSKGWGYKIYWPSVEGAMKPDAETIKTYSGMDRYSVSKFANTAWMLALSRRLAASSESLAETGDESARKMTAVAMNPGLMPGTNLFNNGNAFIFWLIVHVGPLLLPLLKLLREDIKSPRESGEALAWLAVGEGAKGLNGEYMNGKKMGKSSELAGRESVGDELWEWTVKVVGTEGKL
ncbi:NAD(P)-binding protein [Amniculicola lignicola CBS 123094]|uniref:NAD(P)-binding protein n=1 Tax=Amniculicola lignicola CBS 123094 TaxID=1392246 RepID=A0A6A5X4C6_9PLEO|nr:NAD(P)-binding protein [Amniculicola lignicola CBS 123094]